MRTREEFIQEAMLRIVGSSQHYAFVGMPMDNQSASFRRNAESVAKGVRMQAEILADVAGLTEDRGNQ